MLGTLPMIHGIVFFHQSQELIQLIKNSQIPVICMCNDRSHPKMRSLVNYCFDLRFQRPRVKQIQVRHLFYWFQIGQRKKVSFQVLGTSHALLVAVLVNTGHFWYTLINIRISDTFVQTC